MRPIWILAQNTIRALVRKKDFYVFFMMLIVLLAFLMCERFFGMDDISRHMKDIGFFCLWLFSFIIAVTFSAKQLPEEIQSKAVYPLLAKPVSRFHFLAGRFLGALLASSAAYTVFYALYACVILTKGEGIALPLLIQAYILGICFLSIACAISIFLTLYLTLSAAVTASFIIYFSIVWFIDTMRAHVIHAKGVSLLLSNIVYYLIPHYEFFDLRVRLAHSWEALPLWVICFLLIYTTACTAIILSMSLIKLRRKVF